MSIKKVYLDTSVFMAEFNKKDKWHKPALEFFTHVKKIRDIELCSSKWAMTEMVKANRLAKDDGELLKIIQYKNDLLDKNKIRNLKLKFLDVSPATGYDFNHFFNDLGKDLVNNKTGNNKPGLGDIIHIRIMKNNRVKLVVSFDSNFENVDGLTYINPATTKLTQTV